MADITIGEVGENIGMSLSMERRERLGAEGRVG